MYASDVMKKGCFPSYLFVEYLRGVLRLYNICPMWSCVQWLSIE